MLAAEVLGLVAGSLTTTSFVAQVAKTHRSKRADDVSLVMLVTFSLGVVLWLAYGVATGAIAVIATNAATLALCATLLVLKARYSRRRAPAE